jgi:glycogen operon protein
LCFNANDHEQDFVTPNGDYAKEWVGDLDTASPIGDSDLVVAAGEKILLQARSLLVLRKTA